MSGAVNGSNSGVARDRRLFDNSEINRTNNVRPTNDVRLQLPGQVDTYEGPRSADLASTRTGTSMSSQEIRSYIEQRQQQLPPTTASLNQIVSELQQRGAAVAIATHAGGRLPSDDKIVLPNGQCVDTIVSVGGADAHWGFNPDGGYDPNVNVVGPNGEMVKYGDYLTQRGLPIPPYTPPPPELDAGGGWSDLLHALFGFFDVFTPDRAAEDGSKKYEQMDGWETDRLNNPNDRSGKYVFGRWIQDKKVPPTTEALRAFVAANPDWEMRGEDNIRIKPEMMYKYDKADQPSIWQDAIRDVGGPNAKWQFNNA